MPWCILLPDLPVRTLNCHHHEYAGRDAIVFSPLWWSVAVNGVFTCLVFLNTYWQIKVVDVTKQYHKTSFTFNGWILMLDSFCMLFPYMLLNWEIFLCCLCPTMQYFYFQILFWYCNTASILCLVNRLFKLALAMLHYHQRCQRTPLMPCDRQSPVNSL